MKALEAERQQALEAAAAAASCSSGNAKTAVRLRRSRASIIQAQKPPPRADLSDIDRQARTTERAPKPTNPMPFSRGNTSERIEAAAPAEARRTAPPQPEPAQPAARRVTAVHAAGRARTRRRRRSNSAQQKPQQRSGRRASSPMRSATCSGTRRSDSFDNPQGGEQQDFAPSIQFDTKGVEFGPWLRRFIAQIRRNWFIPYAAMSMHGHVVVTFNVHKDGRITDLQVLRPSPIDAFNNSAQNAILASNPTQPLPPEYPDDKAFFTVTFFFNETPTANARDPDRMRHPSDPP